MAKNWFALLQAFRDSNDIPKLGDSIVTVNGRFKDINGEYVEVDSDYHKVCMELAGDFKKYEVEVRVDSDNHVTAAIKIKDLGYFSFPITGKDEHFNERVKITPCLSEFRKDEKLVSELKQVYDWVNRICLERDK